MEIAACRFPIAFAGRDGYIRGMRRAVILIGGSVLAVVLLTVAGYTAYWYSAAATVREQIARWALDRRAAGWQVEMASPDIGGYPAKIVVTIASARLAGPGAPAAWTWTLPPVHAWAKPWAPRTIHVSVPGRHAITAGGDSYAFSAGSADAVLTAGDGKVSHGDLRLGGVELVRPADDLKLSAGRMHIRFGREELATPSPDDGQANDSGRPPVPEQGLALLLQADRLSLPVAWKAPLGTVVDRVSLDAVVTGRVEPRGTLPQVLARWRDSGGAVEVHSLDIAWRALRLKADGTFALDGDLQPEGATTAEIEGIDKTADALIAAGVIDARTAFAAKVANKALTLGGGPARLPVTVQDRQLFLGPVPLLKLKKISWK